MSLAETIANAFGGCRRQGKGFQCNCPCHDDKRASLGVIDSDDGQDVIFNCLAGCDWKDIKQHAKNKGLINGSNGALKKLSDSRSVGAITYSYVDINGREVCQKVRYPGKKFSIQRYQNGTLIKNVQGVDVPPYNLPAVIASDTVYICEGEKDADNLINQGLCATTNIAGGSHWDNRYNEYFRNKLVIICQDNDDVGKKRTDKIIKALQGIAREIKLFAPDSLAEKEDVTDWLLQGNQATDIAAQSVSFSITRADNSNKEQNLPVSKSQKSKTATQADYFTLIETFLKPKRCIFSEKLMCKDVHSGLWNPAINHLDRLKSEALRLNELGSIKYNTAHIQPHFFEYESKQKPLLLVEIPKWDGVDRIGELARAVKLKDEAGVSNIAFEDLLKEWCARVFARLNDPMFQNRMLILQSRRQGIGKDTWINMLCGGLGQFCIPLAVMKEDKDTYLNLSRGLICSVSEFDKTSRTESAVLKDLITAASTNIRAPYDHDSKMRINRCSFISSANVENLLRDSTGSRRFLVFELEEIEYFYRTWTRGEIRRYQGQCIAQMRQLFLGQHLASDQSWSEINEYLEKQTPDDPANTLLDQFLAQLKSDLNYLPGKDYNLNDKTIVETIKKITERTRLTYNGALTLLKNRIGVFRRIGSKRWWVLRIPTEAQVEYNEDEQF